MGGWIVRCSSDPRVRPGRRRGKQHQAAETPPDPDKNVTPSYNSAIDNVIPTSGSGRSSSPVSTSPTQSAPLREKTVAPRRNYSGITYRSIDGMSRYFRFFSK
jgi:hypothetical protein